MVRAASFRLGLLFGIVLVLDEFFSGPQGITSSETFGFPSNSV